MQTQKYTIICTYTHPVTALEAFLVNAKDSCCRSNRSEIVDEFAVFRLLYVRKWISAGTNKDDLE